MEIAQARDGLSKSLKRIADFVLSDPPGFALRTAADLGAELEVAPSAIVRFAKRFGYSGFSGMQTIFRNEIREESISYRERICKLEKHGECTDTDATVAKLVDAGVVSLQQMHKSIPAEKIDAAAALMADARIVHVMAQKRTFATASYLYYNLARLDVPTNLLDGAGGMLEQRLRLISSDDLLFIISFQPGAEDTASAFKIARAKGAKTIAIYDSARMPFIEADVCFSVQEAAVENFRSLNATITLALILAIRTGTLCVKRNANTEANAGE